MQTSHFYNLHNILKIRTVIENPGRYDSYLEKTYRHYEVEDEGDADLVITIGRFAADLSGCAMVDGKYFVKDNYLFYRSRYKLAHWNTEIQGIEGRVTRVRIDCNSFGRMVIPGETIYNLIRFKLAQKGYPLIHGSAVGQGGDGYVFSARGGTGKTITSLNFVRRGLDFYSDDSVMLHGESALGFVVPFNLRFTYDVESLLGVHFSGAVRRELFVKRLISLFTLGRISLFTTLEPKEVFPRSIRDKARLKKAFILVQGPRLSIEEHIPLEWATQEMLINMQFEAPELTGLILAYSYCFPLSPAGDFWDRVEGQIRDSLAGAETHRITVPVVYTKEVFEEIYRKVLE